MRPVRLLVFLHAAGDDMALLPVLRGARERGDYDLRICVAKRFATRFPGAIAQFEAQGWRAEIVGAFGSRWLHRPGLSKLDALLTGTESSLPIHRIAHALTQRASRRGLCTYTLQQGLENVGLNYFDERHGTDICIAARRILIWGRVDALPRETPPATRARCATVGATKSFPKAGKVELKRGRPVVAVFENLHWHRYSARYRAYFFNAVREAALAAPETEFILKPHAKSVWSAQALAEGMPANVRLASDSSRESGPILAASADRVVTTPSTIALDAAVADTPVAIMALELNAEYYAPLDLLSSAEEMVDFIRRGQPREARRTFVERVLVEGDAVKRVLDLIAEETAANR